MSLANRRLTHLAAIVLVAACAGDERGTPFATENDLIHQFNASSAELIQGESKLLLVSVTGGDGLKPPTLRSCSSTVPDLVAVVVESRGCWVTGVRPGKTTIVARTSFGTSARIELTVIAPSTPLLSLP